MADLERIVTHTGIDMSANAVRIGIDPALANTPDRCNHPDDGWHPTSDQAFQAKAAEITLQLQDLLDIAFVIVDGRGFGHYTGNRTLPCATEPSAEAVDP